MGVSTNAYLVYGLSFEDEGGPEDFREKLIKFFKMPEKNPKYPDSDTELFDIEEGSLKKLGLEIVSHCHSEYPMYIIGVAAPTAYRGSPVKIDKIPKLSKKQLKVLEELQELFDGGEIDLWLCSYSEH
jgi:hypothetical protein